jgi:hypothetical protein
LVSVGTYKSGNTEHVFATVSINGTGDRAEFDD